MNCSLRYNKGDNCPLSVLISLICDNDMSELRNCPDISIDALKMAKNNIIFDYTRICGDKENEIAIQQLNKIYLLQCRIHSLNLCVNLVKSGLYEDVIPFLKSLYVSIKKHDTREDMIRNLKVIRATSKKIQMQLIEELEKYNKKSNSPDSKKITRMDFERQIAAISKFMGFKIDKDKTTVNEYASYVYQYKIHLNDGNKQHTRLSGVHPG